MSSILIKTLARSEYRINVNDASTVGSVKGELAALGGGEGGEMPVDRQKLIFQGKVLADGQYIAELGITEGQYFVLMVEKPRSVTSPPASAAPLPVPFPPAAPAAVAPGLLFPAHPPAPPLQALRNHPQFPALRAMIQQNPAALQQILQMLAQTNPEIVAEINNNEAAFIALLSEGDDYDDEADGDYEDGVEGEYDEEEEVQYELLRIIASCPPGQEAQLAATLGISPERYAELAAMLGSLSEEELADLMQDDEQDDDPVQEQDLNDAERASVQRLADMGFSPEEALQAFLSCDRNEGLAANWLLDG